MKENLLFVSIWIIQEKQGWHSCPEPESLSNFQAADSDRQRIYNLEHVVPWPRWAEAAQAKKVSFLFQWSFDGLTINTGGCYDSQWLFGKMDHDVTHWFLLANFYNQLPLWASGHLTVRDLKEVSRIRQSFAALV